MRAATGASGPQLFVGTSTGDIIVLAGDADCKFHLLRILRGLHRHRLSSGKLGGVPITRLVMTFGVHAVLSLDTAELMVWGVEEALERPRLQRRKTDAHDAQGVEELLAELNQLESKIEGIRGREEAHSGDRDWLCLPSSFGGLPSQN